MDPNSNLKEQLRLARKIQDCNHLGQCDCIHDADTLADLVTALDGWIKNGGFLPSRWGAKP